MEEKYPKFESIPRLNRTFVISEKIDGTNGLIEVRKYPGEETALPLHDKITGVIHVSVAGEDYELRAGSRSRWLKDSADNFGFWHWVLDNRKELTKLGEGRHYGEWYGKGIQRGYGLDEKRFMLFNTDRWSDDAERPECCEVATVLARSSNNLTMHVERTIADLKLRGSAHVPGFSNPEGVVVYHTAARQYFKVTVEGDEVPKTLRAVA